MYSPTSSPFLIQLILLNFHDVTYRNFNFSNMCRRSERRVLELAAWINAAWQLSFIRIWDVLWPLVLWVVWYNWLTLCYQLWSQIQVLLYRLTVTGNTIYRSLFINQYNLESRRLAWLVWPLHTQWRNLLSHTLVTEIQKTLTCNKVGLQIAFTRVTSSKISIWLSTPPVMQVPSSCLRPNAISRW